MIIPYSKQAQLMMEKMADRIDKQELETFFMQNSFMITGGHVLQYLELKAENRLTKDLKIID